MDEHSRHAKNTLMHPSLSCTLLKGGIIQGEWELAHLCLVLLCKFPVIVVLGPLPSLQCLVSLCLEKVRKATLVLQSSSTKSARSYRVYTPPNASAQRFVGTATGPQCGPTAVRHDAWEDLSSMRLCSREAHAAHNL